MRKRGAKAADQTLENLQIDWLLIPRNECSDEMAERAIVACHFRVPHEPWGATRAFVGPVTIRRSRRRVLFYQESGVLV